jgi:putative oxidoreductase
MSDAHTIDLGLFLLRAGVGVVLLVHGAGKLRGRPGLDATARWFESIGLSPGRGHAVAAALTELVVGAALVLGLLTDLATAGLLALMVVAVAKATGRRGFGAERGGWEYNGVLILVALTLAVTGPGRWSLDHALGVPNAGAVGIAVTLVVGLVGAFGLLGTARLTATRSTAGRVAS